MLKSVTTILGALALATLPVAALADKKGHERDRERGHARSFCPPGLAKKSPACVPPGQAKKSDRYYRGDRYDHDRHDHDRLGDRDRDAYGLPRLRAGEGYYRDGEVVYRVSEETRLVLDVIRLGGRLLGN